MFQKNAKHRANDASLTMHRPSLVHSAGVDLDAAVQVRWLRDADRMEIKKCDRLTYILTRVGARDGCASRCGPVGPYFRD